jgi:hypothetical protein
MYMRALAGAAALALAAGSHAAISVSFASGSANVSQIFEVRQEFGPANGGNNVITVSTVENVEVDLIVNPSGPDLFTQRAGFEAMFYIDAGGFGPANGGGGPFAFGGELNGSFRFYDANDPSETLLLGFVSNGLGFFVASGVPPIGGGDPFGFIAGSLVGPGTSYFLNDPINGSSLGFPGGGLMGDSAFTLTNFEQIFDEDNGGQGPGDLVARATGSFSGTLIPSTGTGVLSALALGVVATRRRR